MFHTLRARITGDPKQFVIECGQWVAVLAGYVVVTGLVCVWLDPVVPGRSLAPVKIFTAVPVLGAFALALIGIVLKPVANPTSPRDYALGFRTRTAILFGTLVLFFAFAVGVFGQPPGPKALPGLLGDVADAEFLQTGVPFQLLGLGLVAVLLVLLSAVTVGGFLVGAVGGSIAGLVGWSLSINSLVAGALVGGMLGAVAVTALMGLDPRQVDQSGIAAGSVVGVAVMVLAPVPELVLGWSTIAAGTIAGMEWQEIPEDRPTNALRALRLGGSLGAIPGFESLAVDPENSPDTREAAFAGLRYPGGAGWSILVNIGVLVFLSPLLLFVPLIFVLGYLFRITAAAAHGYDRPPDLRIGRGRRALFREGVVGTVVLGLPLLLAGSLVPPLTHIGGYITVGETRVTTSDVGALLIDVYHGFVLPAPLVDNAVLAFILFVGVIIWIPLLAISYATGGSLRTAFDPRRLADLLSPRYAAFLGIQLGYLLVIPLAATVAAGLGFAVALAIAEGVGILGGVLGVLVFVGCLTFLMLLPAASASLWGLYACGHSVEEYRPLAGVLIELAKNQQERSSSI